MYFKTLSISMFTPVHDIFVYWGTLLGRAAQGLKDGQVWPEPEKSKVHDILCIGDPLGNGSSKPRKWLGLARARKEQISRYFCVLGHPPGKGSSRPRKWPGLAKARKD